MPLSVINNNPALINGLIQKDQGAWDTLMENSFWELRKFVKGLIEARTLTQADEDIVRDLVVDTWEAVYDAIGNYNPNLGYLFSTWLFEIAKNLVGQHFRKTAKKPDIITLEESELEDFRGALATKLPVPSVYDPEEEAKKEVREKEAYRKATHGLHSIPQLERQVITLKEIHGCPFGEVAQALGINVNTAKSHHRRGMARLRKIM